MNQHYSFLTGIPIQMPRSKPRFLVFSLLNQIMSIDFETFKMIT